MPKPSQTLRPRRHGLFASISALALPFALFGAVQPALAQEAAEDENDIIVTATRRAVSIQDIPLNIAAVGAEQIEQQGIQDLTQLSSQVAGLYVIDRGSTAANSIIVRGLNADPVGSADGDNSGGGTVATYVDEIPLFIDLRLEDIERVEVLLGPQGTLYGSGTLGGAVRYIPRLPQFNETGLELRGDVSDYSAGEELNTDFGATFNIPIADRMALRGSVDRLQDQGYIDYNYIVREIGVSDPDEFQTPAERAANLAPETDANDVDSIAGRIALRWEPLDGVDTTLTYWFQNMQIGGRSRNSGRGSISGVGDYESTARVRETFTRDNELLAWQTRVDLGFAELTASTGYSRYSERSRRDQTDLLLMLNPTAGSYYYDNFPSFTAVTDDVDQESTLTQELRLVSTGDGPFSWIVGAFYSQYRSAGTSREFTPHFSQYLVDNYGASFRTDGLEYISQGRDFLVEEGYYFEGSYRFTPRWQVTLGGRWYSYDLRSSLAVDLPLLNTAYFGQPDGEINLVPEFTAQSDDGFIWKFNTSYDVTDDVMVYFTRSSGFRIGNDNGIEACEVPPNPGQNVCGQPNELAFGPDRTVNYEIGTRTQWFDGRLTVNAAAYIVEWEGPQVSSATQIGSQPITINGGDAQTTGFEVNFNAEVTDRFTLRGSYSQNVAEFQEISPLLITVLNNAGNFVPTNFRTDGLAGDRLPGSPQHQGSLSGTYTWPMANESEMRFSLGVTGVSEVLSRTGGRGNGLTLPGYQVYNTSLAYETPRWEAVFYVNNLLDEFYETGVTGSVNSNVIFGATNGLPTDDAGGNVHVRSYYTNSGRPRTIGVRMRYRFGDT